MQFHPAPAAAAAARYEIMWPPHVGIIVNPAAAGKAGAALPFGMLSGFRLRQFPGKQDALPRRAPAVVAESTGAADHAMAGNEIADRVGDRKSVGEGKREDLG